MTRMFEIWQTLCMFQCVPRSRIWQDLAAAGCLFLNQIVLEHGGCKRLCQGRSGIFKIIVVHHFLVEKIQAQRDRWLMQGHVADGWWHRN